MPDVTLTVSTPTAARIKAGLEHEGWTGTNAEALAEVKARTVRFWKAWLRNTEHNIAEAAIAATDADIT